MRPRIYIGGTFDLFHAGHVELFRNASRLGHVTVALNRDEFAARYKRPPVMRLEERLVVVRACRYVDRAIINATDEDSKPTILRAGATHVMHGNILAGEAWSGDWLIGQMGLTPEFLAANRISLIFAPYTATVSTTEIIERCAKATSGTLSGDDGSSTSAGTTFATSTTTRTPTSLLAALSAQPPSSPPTADSRSA